MLIEDVKKWFRKEVLGNRYKYPNLHKTEVAKNQLKFEEEE